MFLSLMIIRSLQFAADIVIIHKQHYVCVRARERRVGFRPFENNEFTHLQTNAPHNFREYLKCTHDNVVYSWSSHRKCFHTKSQLVTFKKKLKPRRAGRRYKTVTRL